MGHGLSLEVSVKYGPVTLLSVVQTADKLTLLTAEAESVAVQFSRLETRTVVIVFRLVRDASRKGGMRKVRHIIAGCGSVISRRN